MMPDAAALAVMVLAAVSVWPGATGLGLALVAPTVKTRGAWTANVAASSARA
jgi:hypothetical protein